MVNNTVTFETKCYENDWRFLLKTSLLDRIVDNCNHPFTEKRLYINNVKNVEEVKRYADKKISQSVIDSYYLVGDYASEVLTFFDLTKEDFKGGYLYSISELVSIYLSKTDFVFHLSSDSFLLKSQNDWIGEAVNLFNSNPEVIVANALWDKKYAEAALDSNSEDSKWWYSLGFSDQNYLIRTRDFQNKIYSEQNEMSEKFPLYGGDSFEKKVFNFMANHNKLRATYKMASYQHKNFPKDLLANRLLYLKMRLFYSY